MRYPGVRLALTVALMAAGIGMSGCTLKRFVADNMSGTLHDVESAFYNETSVRHAREGAPGLLLLLDGFIVSSPENEELLLAAAEMNCSFAIGLVEIEDPEWAMRLYTKGRDYALRALAKQSEEFTQTVATGTLDDLSQLLATDFEDSEDVPALFWTAMCWGSWINLNLDSMDAVAELPWVEAIMKRVAELDETYFYGGPHLFFGTANGMRPTMIGGDPQASRRHFERVFELTNRSFLLAHVFFAKTYTVQVQDYGLFRSTLQEVLDAPADIDPDRKLITAIAKKQAGLLLDQAATLFLGAEDAVPPADDDSSELDSLLD